MKPNSFEQELDADIKVFVDGSCGFSAYKITSTKELREKLANFLPDALLNLLQRMGRAQNDAVGDEGIS